MISQMPLIQMINDAIEKLLISSQCNYAFNFVVIPINMTQPVKEPYVYKQIEEGKYAILIDVSLTYNKLLDIIIIACLELLQERHNNINIQEWYDKVHDEVDNRSIEWLAKIDPLLTKEADV